MNVLFIDPKASETYDFEYLKTHSIGGTESTLLNIVRGLASTNEVTVAQLNRPEEKSEFNVKYIAIDSLESRAEYQPDVVILLRKYKLLTKYRQLYPNAKLYVWVHNFQNHDVLGRRHRIVDSKAKVICVSEAHKRYMQNILNGTLSWFFRFLTFRFQSIDIESIYNPVDEIKLKHVDPVDPNKLLFFSTPNKGLDQVLKQFEILVETQPQYHLYIAGADLNLLKSHQLDTPIVYSKQVTVLGKIPREKTDHHIQTSFCVFYTQNTFAETFGLIFAEANRVGTPVLTADIGAAAEILSDDTQLIDVSNSQTIAKTLESWQQQGRPKVFLKDSLKLQRVIEKWQLLISNPKLLFKH
ncbi:MAG: glycosyltransferase family 4 protein [Gammaproteobacteria bacterium]|nr:glycosyltransferase family 4 protein [Gammaproteobacteria bacterium]